jgi:hypothetical protein
LGAKVIRASLAIICMLTFVSSEAADFRCSKPGFDPAVSFVLKNGQVTDFIATSALSGKEFAQGYTLTCVQHIGKFSQAARDNEYVLRFRMENDQYGESQNCKVVIEESESTFRVRTVGCRSECMKFDFRVSKKGTNCYRIQ